MITNTATELRYGSGVSTPAGPSDDRVRHRELIEARRIAPVYVLKTGAVRPQAGDSVLHTAMTAAPSSNGTDWVHTWSPPD
jgi:hypothetical protein